MFRETVFRESKPGKTKALQTAAIILTVYVLFGSAVLFAGGPSSPTPPDPAYVQSFEKWKAEEIDDLKQNWLPLAGLYWLKPGVNSFGTAADNAVVFPKDRLTPASSILRAKR